MPIDETVPAALITSIEVNPVFGTTITTKYFNKKNLREQEFRSNDLLKLYFRASANSARDAVPNDPRRRASTTSHPSQRRERNRPVRSRRNRSGKDSHCHCN